MKKRTKGILAFAFLGGIMVTSGVTIAIPGIIPEDSEMNMEFTETGTPADNYPDVQRAQFCGDGTTSSNTFVAEFSIPTECTQPLAITSDFEGNIWFMQTNTGNVAKFDTDSQTFSEYDNPFWPTGARSMVWGMDYSPDNSIWYSDEANDSVWRFSIDEQTYQRFNFPSEGNALPQRLVIDGSQVIINDFTGNKITIMDASAYSEDTPYISIPSPVAQSVTAGFTKDSESNLWYTNWVPNMDGVLVKFDFEQYSEDLPNAPESGLGLNDYLEIFRLPAEAIAINGAVADISDTIWLVDTATSHFFSFDPSSESFTQYITSPVPDVAFGNHTGVIKTTPLSRPYWTGLDNQGQVIFNEQTANRIGLFDPNTEKLTEYSIPSMNPNWADCGNVDSCGIAQTFDFTVVDDKIWFTQWATNNIGVIDTSIPSTIDVSLDANEINYDENSSISLKVTSNSNNNIKLVSHSPTDGLITLSPTFSEITLSEGSSNEILFDISTSEELLPGKYKVLVGAQTSEIAVSQFFTLVVG